MKTIRTSESVCAGHPDKLCDFIADSVLDACLKADPNSRVACEVLATKGHIVLAGEITCKSKKPMIVLIHKAVRDALAKRGYKARAFPIDLYVHAQSEDISGGVSRSLEARAGGEETLGAGDQGTVYGYATNETADMLPLPLALAHNICRALDTARKKKQIKGILPDGKAQVSVEYEGERPVHIASVVVSVQHESNKDPTKLANEVREKILKPIFAYLPFDSKTEVLINPSGRFVEGGPDADTGLTGRKIMVDTYGGLSSHGGGAFSGKDPTKVDRSGAYMARFIAKNIVRCDLAKRCEVAISYAIGKAEPVAVNINTFGTGAIPDDEIRKIVLDSFDMRPGEIIRLFDLRSPIYAATAAYGHFQKTFPWEKTYKTIHLWEKAEEKEGKSF